MALPSMYLLQLLYQLLLIQVFAGFRRPRGFPRFIFIGRGGAFVATNLQFANIGLLPGGK